MTHTELVSRKQLLTELDISDSSERRGRRGNHEWPPHLRIGTKVYYRRAAIARPGSGVVVRIK